MAITRAELRNAFENHYENTGINPSAGVNPLSRIDTAECAYLGTLQALKEAGLTK